MVPSLTSETAQPWCVQATENALTVSCAGRVTTTLAAAKMVPPPTGMSASWASGAPPPGAGDWPAGGLPASGTLVGSPYDWQPAVAAPAAPTAATDSTVRRRGPPGAFALIDILTAWSALH